uniref:Uncharacterized protein n=1 Tax=Rhizophora mucronata TaxID=61149 RepID=A0A2P2P6E5_RHIMU
MWRWKKPSDTELLLWRRRRIDGTHPIRIRCCEYARSKVLQRLLCFLCVPNNTDPDGRSRQW